MAFVIFFRSFFKHRHPEGTTTTREKKNILFRNHNRRENNRVAHDEERKIENSSKNAEKCNSNAEIEIVPINQIEATNCKFNLKRRFSGSFLYNIIHLLLDCTTIFVSVLWTWIQVVRN